MELAPELHVALHVLEDHSLLHHMCAQVVGDLLGGCDQSPSDHCLGGHPSQAIITEGCWDDPLGLQEAHQVGCHMVLQQTLHHVLVLGVVEVVQGDHHLRGVTGLCCLGAVDIALGVPGLHSFHVDLACGLLHV